MKDEIPGEREGRRKLSWIWTRVGAVAQTSGDQELHNGNFRLLIASSRS